MSDKKVKVLGIKNSTKETRFAILEQHGDEVTMLNIEDNRLKFPANNETIEDDIRWLDSEINALIDKHSDVSKIVIKIPEFLKRKGKGETKSHREISHKDGAIINISIKRGINVETKLYERLKTNSKEVKDVAQQIINGQTKSWNPQIADAIVAANSIIQGG